MRSKWFLILVIGVLMCAIATREFPELLQLVDQTSNDFTLLNASNEGKTISFAKQKSDQFDLTNAARHEEQISPKPTVRLTPFLAARSSFPDPLLFSCILRT